jgi:hypothetical protein
MKTTYKELRPMLIKTNLNISMNKAFGGKISVEAIIQIWDKTVEQENICLHILAAKGLQHFDTQTTQMRNRQIFSVCLVQLGVSYSAH